MSMVLFLVMMMTTNQDWDALITNIFKADNSEACTECRELPTNNTGILNNVGSEQSSNGKGSSDNSLQSRQSLHIKQGKGKDDNLATHAGELDGKYFCDKYRLSGADISITVSNNEGHECASCTHLNMLVFHKPNTRRKFHWRCVQGFNILEAGYAGERVLIAPIECNKYSK